jgi:hypothetical protein
MTARLLSLLCGLILGVPYLGLPTAVGAGEKPVKEEAVFEMREVSAFDVDASQALLRGDYAECYTEPFTGVKRYPKLKSKRPLYGALFCDHSRAIHFVLDQSGDTPSRGEESDQKDVKQNGPKKPRTVDLKLSSYDRLYFDANRDLDLTNDPVLKPMKDPSWKSFPAFVYRERMAFESARIDVDYGTGVGVRPFRIFPWLVLGEREDTPNACFAAAVARKGTIQIGKDKYEVLLVQEGLDTCRFDRGSTSVYLTPKNPPARPESFKLDGDLLTTMRRSGDQLYTIATTPLGDKLTVALYRGPLGVFKIGPGNRKLKEIGFQGSFRSKSISLKAAEISVPANNGKTTECKLPVGDYLPWHLRIDYGRLQIAISDNYYAEGQPDETEQDQRYAIPIREDKPFVLDFSNKPAVLFASPATDRPFMPGETIGVKALLIDPKLDIMIIRLDDTSRRKKETIGYGQGKNVRETTYETPRSLAPLVTITNSAGKKVAEGVMPFCSAGTPGYSWRVPKDLKLAGKSETFTITVRYDTLELYGKVEGARKIIVTAE